MAGCGENNTCGTEYTALPLLSGCPGDEETFLVANAVGGQGVGKYGRRTWADIKACTTGSGGGYASLSDTISSSVGPAGATTYQNNDLIGATEVKFVIINKNLYTYEDGDFALNENTGVIAFLTVTIFEGDTITVPYKPA